MRFLTNLTIAAFIATSFSRVYAASEEDSQITFPLILDIEFKGFSDKSNISSEYAEACTKLAANLTASNGIWGFGPFQKVNCTSDKNAPGQWRLLISRLSHGHDGIKFAIFFNPDLEKDRSASPESDLTVDTSQSVTELLDDDETNALIAKRLTLFLPFVGSVVVSDLVPSKSIQVRSPTFDAKDPKELFVFSLKRKSGLWVADVKGKLIRGKTRKQKNEETSYSTQWNYKSRNTSPSEEQVLFVRSARASDVDNIIEQKISNRLSSLIRDSLSFGRSAYVGLRYGFPGTRGDGLLNKARQFGLLAEFRSGWLSGFKFSYDSFPKVKFDADGRTEAFEQSRIQLGYSFGAAKKFGPFDWFDMTPRLGVTNVSYDLEENSDGFITSSKFRQFRSPTTGLEIGAESRGQMFLTRLWVYGHYSLGIASIDKKYSTSGVRAGVDIFRDLTELWVLKISGLAFATYDSVTLKTKEVSDDVNVEQNENDQQVLSLDIEELTLRSFFLGLGIVVRW